MSRSQFQYCRLRSSRTKAVDIDCFELRLIEVFGGRSSWVACEATFPPEDPKDSADVVYDVILNLGLRRGIGIVEELSSLLLEAASFEFVARPGRKSVSGFVGEQIQSMSMEYSDLE